MRTDEPFTGAEIKEQAIFLENLIYRLKKRFPSHHHSKISSEPEIVLLEHNKFVVEKLIKKIHTDLSNTDFKKVLDITSRLFSNIDTNVVDPSEVFDVDEFLKEETGKINDDSYKPEDTSETFDVDEFYANNEIKDKSNTELNKLRDDLKSIHEKLEEKIHHSLKK